MTTPRTVKNSKKVEVDESELAPKNVTLNRLGLNDPKEGLLCLPESFFDTRFIVKTLPEYDDEEPRLYSLRFTGEFTGYDINKNLCDLSNSSGWMSVVRLKMTLVDDKNQSVGWSVFGSPWEYRQMAEGEYVNLVCKVKRFGYDLYLQEVLVPPFHAIGHIWVKYLGIKSRVSGEKVQALVHSQLDNPDAFKYCATKLVGALGMMDEEALTSACAIDHFQTFEQVLRALHQPVDTEQGWMAKIVANKLAAMAVQAAALRHNIRHAHPDAPLSLDVGDIEMLAKTQKEVLTKSQSHVANTILNKLRSPRPMNVLLSGDVGTGKTLTYLLPAVAAHRAGAKVAIIAPTSILADQIALQIVSRFGSQVRGVERITANGKIADHGSILVGTPGITAVCTKAKYAPNLLIADEQHKLSTAIREKLVKPWTHTLEVTATPIPRSLASALFGGKDILNLDECPYKKEINCEVGDVSMRPRFSAMIKKALDKGERAAVIYPRVNSSVSYTENENGETIRKEKDSVLSGAAALEKAFPGKVVAIHGGMKEEEIAFAIGQVRSGAKPLVVASTVIETGVDIPGITCMIVRDADYFGISQLHQLRGRLVRTGGKANFAMLVSPKNIEDLSEDSYARMVAIIECQNGYLLSEIDLRIRGIGSMVSSESGTQSGASTDTVFKLVKLRPEDFLRKKLSIESLKDSSSDLSAQRAADEEQANENNRHRTQPRLFA